MSLACRGDGDPTAWRGALRVRELAYGSAPAPSTEDVLVPKGVAEGSGLGWRELEIVVAPLRGEFPNTETDVRMTSLAPCR